MCKVNAHFSLDLRSPFHMKLLIIISLFHPFAQAIHCSRLQTQCLFVFFFCFFLLLSETIRVKEDELSLRMTIVRNPRRGRRQQPSGAIAPDGCCRLPRRGAFFFPPLLTRITLRCIIKLSHICLLNFIPVRHALGYTSGML